MVTAEPRQDESHIGQTYGWLKVIEDLGLMPHRRARMRHVVRCQCRCGERFEVLWQSLRSGHTTSCGCRYRVRVRPGDTFERLTVIKDLGLRRVGRSNRRMISCVCSCGVKVTVSHDALQGGKTQSCGCLGRERRQAAATTHGATTDRASRADQRLCRIWINMRARCWDGRNPSYKYYGARGVTIDVRWEEFGPFRDWALTHGYQRNLTIDRMDTFGNYSPENCRWIPLAQQNRNRRSNHLISWLGETKSIIEWTEDPRCPTTKAAILHRLARGWSDQAAVSTPPLVAR
jgi:hypothetical protein